MHRVTGVVVPVVLFSPAWVALWLLDGPFLGVLTVLVIVAYALYCPRGARYFGVLPLLLVVPLVVGGAAVTVWALGSFDDFTPEHCDPLVEECLALGGGDPMVIRESQEMSYWLALLLITAAGVALVAGGLWYAAGRIHRYRRPSSPELGLVLADALDGRRERLEREWEDWEEEGQGRKWWKEQG